MTKSIRLVATVRTKNEAWILETWLERTSEYADAIIVLDDGSEDDSVKIARRCKKVIRVIEKPRGGVWNELPDRNLLLDAARECGAQWVHVIDPDEIMDARLAGVIDELLREEQAGRHFFREVTLWRSTDRYRSDSPEKYGRRDGTNQILRLNPQLRWRHSKGWRRRVFESIVDRRFFGARKVGNLSLGGVRGETRYHELVRLHYHFADWDHAWFLHMRYAVIEGIQTNRKLREVPEIIAWATARMNEEGLQLKPVDPMWGALALQNTTPRATA